MKIDVEIINAVGQIAGIGGISLGIFLSLFKEIIKKIVFLKFKIENEVLLYKLLRLVIISVWSIAVIGIGAWVFSSNKETSEQNNAQNSTDIPKLKIDPVTTKAPGNPIISVDGCENENLSALKQKRKNQNNSYYESKNLSFIKNPVHVMSKYEIPNLLKSINYLSGCYVDDCYTYQLKIIDLIETDISNQYLKGIDWHIGLSIYGDKVGTSIHSTEIKIRSNGKRIDEIRRKNALKLDDKVYVWLDSLNICNR